MELKQIMEEHEKIKARLKMLFQTRGKINAFLDFDELEIVFLIKPPNNDAVLKIAREILEVDDDNSIIIRGKGLYGTIQIKKKINRFVEALENL